MTSSFEEKIKNLEREIIELKTERQKVMAATTTIAKEITCQSKSTMNSSGNVVADTMAIITITPSSPAGTNNFVFTVAQDGIASDGEATFSYDSRLGQNDGEFELMIWTQSYNGAWNVGTQKTITHNVRVVATDQFTTVVTEQAA